MVFVSKSKLLEYFSMCFEYGKSFNMKEKYEDFYNEGIELLKDVNRGHISIAICDQLNQWFCCFANGFVEFEMEELYKDDFKDLMNYTTKVHFSISVDDYVKDDEVVFTL